MSNDTTKIVQVSIVKINSNLHFCQIWHGETFWNFDHCFWNQNVTATGEVISTNLLILIYIFIWFPEKFHGVPAISTHCDWPLLPVKQDCLHFANEHMAVMSML